MTHDEIRDGQFIDLYLLDRLDPARRECFEEHLVGCPQCADELELQRAFITGVRELGPGEFSASAGEDDDRAGSARRWRALALAAMLLLAITGPLSISNLYRSAGSGADITAAGPIVMMTLVQTRSAGTDTPNVLELRGDEGWLMLEPEGEYRASALHTVSVGQGERETFRDRVRSDALGALVLALPPRTLEAGDYTVRIAPEDQSASAQQFTLHVVTATP
jgi:hypothetical protein